MKTIASPFNPRRVSAISRVFNAVFFSAEAKSSPSPRSDTLLQRITNVNDQKVSIVPLLDQWLKEGRKVSRYKLQDIVKLLRKFRRYPHALQVQQWMVEKMKYKDDSGSIAICLDLILKVHGFQSAVHFFSTIPISLRDHKIYSSMLSCYVSNGSWREADKLYQKMKELGFVKTTLIYNVMLSLYARTGNLKKFDVLVEEMKENGLTGDSYTSNIILNAYVNTNNVEKMEKLFSEMEKDSHATVDLLSYFTVIKGYVRAGFSQKALTLLTKAEEATKINGTRRDYEILVTLYADLKKRDDVYRVWDMYINTGPALNTGYISMLTLLWRLGDIAGAAKISEEWETDPFFDPRVANLVIMAYCNNGNLEKALALSEKITSEGKNLHGSAWQCLAKHCCEGNTLKAVEMMRKALSENDGPNWRLNKRVLASCLDYLKSKGDKVKASELMVLVRERGCFFSNRVCDRLLDFVFSDKDSGALALMED